MLHADKHGVCIIPLRLRRSWPRPARKSSAPSGRSWRSAGRASSPCNTTSSFARGCSPRPTSERRGLDQACGRRRSETPALYRARAITTGSYWRLRPTTSSGRVSSSRLPSAYQRPLRNSKTAVASRPNAKWSKGSASKWTADQGQEAAGLPVAGPEDLVVPLRVFPPRTFGGIDPAQGGHEPGLQPLALVVERFAGLVDVEIFEELSKRPLKQEERR